MLRFEILEYIFELPYSPVVAANDLLLQLLVLNLMKFRQNGLNLCLIAWNSTNVFKSYTNQTKLRCFVCKSFKNENLNLFCAKLLKIVVLWPANVLKKWKTSVFSCTLNTWTSKNNQFHYTKILAKVPARISRSSLFLELLILLFKIPEKHLIEAPVLLERIFPNSCFFIYGFQGIIHAINHQSQKQK